MMNVRGLPAQITQDLPLHSDSQFLNHAQGKSRAADASSGNTERAHGLIGIGIAADAPALGGHNFFER